MEGNTFKKRPGTTERGKEYEELVVAYLILELIGNTEIKNFSLSSNDDKFGAFDDVVVERENLNGTKQFHALQLKHVNKTRNLSLSSLSEQRGNFSIKKYFEDFKKLGHFDNHVTFILFTNRQFYVPAGETFNFGDEVVEVKLVQIPMKHESDNSLFNTTDAGCCYKFETINGEYKEFFENFYLFANQLNAQRLKEKVRRKFEDMFSTDKSSFLEYLIFINQWNLREGKKPKLDTVMMRRVITLQVLARNIVPLSFKTPPNAKSKILREVITETTTTIFGTDKTDTIKEIYGDAINHLHNTKEVNEVGFKYQIISSYVRDISMLNDLEISKLLWLMNKCPLLVTENQNLERVINLCKDLKFIVLVKQTSRAMFQNLSNLNLDKEQYGKILANFECSMQGKRMDLQSFIGQSLNLPVIFTTNELAEMLHQPLAIGGSKEILPEPYINRYLSSNFIDYKYLQESREDTLVVISCHGNFDQLKDHIQNFTIIDDTIENSLKRRNTMDLEKEISTSLVSNTSKEKIKIYVSETECMEWQFDKIYKNNPRKTKYHHVRVVGGNLEWVRSKGGIEDLEEYRFDGPFIEERRFREDMSHNIHIISADPGMGKTMLMKNIKNQIPSSFWTVMIYPKEHISYFHIKRFNAKNFIAYILRATNKKFSPFELGVLDCLREEKRILFIWDGLDEISDEDLQSAMRIIQELTTEKFLQILTARSHLKKILESKFGVFARDLKPFDELEQDCYIKSRLNLTENDDVVTKIKKNIELVRYNDILGIPLQIFMLTELFRQDREKYSLLFNRIFSLTDLYHHFVDEKFNVFYIEKAKVDISNDIIKQMIDTCKKVRLKNYRKAALKVFFEELKITCDKFLDEIKEGDCFGIITEVSKEGMPNFVHNSYGEYFAATYFAKNYKKDPRFKELIFEDRHRNIRFLFDLLLAKDCEGHIAVLYKNLDALLDSESQLNRKDLAGRNPLHLASTWAEKFQPVKKKSIGTFRKKVIVDEAGASSVRGESWEFQKILEHLCKECDPYETDGLFNLDSFTYANKFSTLLPMVALSKKHKKNITDFSSFKDISSVLYYCVRFDYEDIFDIIEEIPCLETKDQLSLLHLAAKYSAANCLKKLLFHYNSQLFDNSTYLSIGRWLDNSKTDINHFSEKGFTPLHLACYKGNVTIVQLLIDNAADFSIKNSEGTTPLLVACEKGQLDVIKYLIYRHASVNAKNKNGSTPLHVACQNGYTEVVRVLIGAKANVNETNDNGVTPLLKASQNGHRAIVRLLIAHGASVNAANKDDVTPIYMASHNGHASIVRLLMIAKANVNAETRFGYTPLYIAQIKGYLEIVELLKNPETPVEEETCEVLTKYASIRRISSARSARLKPNVKKSIISFT